MEKECFKCARRLPMDCFYKHPETDDGRLGKCKECTKRDVQANYVATREEKRTYERARLQTPRRRESMRRVRVRQRQRPDKLLARKMARAAIESGFLRALPCAICGDEKTDGHHEDYSKPLDIAWLCRTHHARRHAELKAEGITL
jgi:hypothetical protein